MRFETDSKPAGILLDELHVIAEAPDADRVIGQIRGGLISQPEGVNRHANGTPDLEWALGAGQDQAADLTGGRACCSSNCTGLR